ncbi:LysR family transcriptional regulator [Desulfitobacterium hafniense]|uniref:HTH lysR-type domain-containing protein n=2 Tax=Desulfitobacterium hafniense TaxID=49338 RepID=Q250Y6_DESHY|nr:LysR family transcriptional regulator [Desulfitobacterium hafniense]KTE91645.1 LysR family transcriptional regulator [Desulfitobacterium hafniense]MEA5023650.1 LysR family transcriptional regulator [Desulfitobacterium hafniense]BAE82156.1 hypothetical protein DSY0367 [Desulfitobacterium hafniense Y51]CDX00359.1 Transcriptional regulator, LysR [Desulfitobacterium hafniense]
MTLQVLRYVIEVAACASISEAAKALFISQSTLSTAIKQLEEELGIILFRRNNRGIALSPEGEDFLQFARQIVEQANYLENRYQQKKSSDMLFSVSTQRLPFSVRAFVKLMETIGLEPFDIAIRECPTYEVIHDVEAGRSEIGVLAVQHRYLEIFRKLLHSGGISQHKIHTLSPYVFVRKSHPLAQKNSLSIEELKEYPFITFDQGKNSGSHFTEEIVFYSQLDKIVHVSDRCTKIALVRATDAFSIGPDLVNSNGDKMHAGQQEVCAIPLASQSEQLDILWIEKTSRPLTTTAELYVRLLADQVQHYFAAMPDKPDR